MTSTPSTPSTDRPAEPNGGAPTLRDVVAEAKAAGKAARNRPTTGEPGPRAK